MFWKANDHYKEPLLPISDSIYMNEGYHRDDNKSVISETISMYRLHF